MPHTAQGRIDVSTLTGAGTVLLDDLDMESRTGRTHLFRNPVSTLIARSPDDVSGILRRLDEAVSSGMYVAGYLAYEAGVVLDKPIVPRHESVVPLAWLGVYDGCCEFDYHELDPAEAAGADQIHDVSLDIDEDRFLDRIGRIGDYIAAGDVYQVNYTCRLLFRNAASAARLFARLRAAHPVGYSAYIDTGGFQVVSLSPELFLQRTGATVLTRPMKGTIGRGRWYEEDTQRAEELASDTKNLAENLMIVDLMRNDLGRISRPGSVKVPRLFHVERYDSLFQMTSDVEGMLQDCVTPSRMLQATFPPGSVTGAPKLRAVEIIDELEDSPRGVYCGTIGMFRPGGDCLLNVAIRTIIQTGDRCEMGVGSGVVADSVPSAEFRETLLKGSFVKREPADFRLLETLLHKPADGYLFADDHLRRLRRSAEYFGWRPDMSLVLSRMEDAARAMSAHCGSSGAYRFRARLLVSRNGDVDVQWAEMDDTPAGPVRLICSTLQTDPDDVFLYHKTTRRLPYDKALAAAREAGYFDALHANALSDLTEGSITNVFAEIDGEWRTPPIPCGLLPGIWRARAIAESGAVECIIRADDLRRATRVVVGNSVRGAIPVGSIDSPGGEAIFRRAGHPTAQWWLPSR